MVTPVYIGETTTVLKAFDLLKQTPMHMALVIDEFGAREEIETATDLLEMIAGDFDEAHDLDDTPGSITERADGSYLVYGRVEPDDLARALKIELDETGYFRTVAGLLLNEAAHLPSEGEVFRISSFDVEVIDMDARRIDKLLFRKHQGAEMNPASEAGMSPGTSST